MMGTLYFDHRWVRAVAPVAAALFFLFTVMFSVNVPVGDDYVVLKLVDELRQITGLRAFLEILYAPHGEHRIVLTKALAYAISFLPNGLDFRALEFVAVLALCGAMFALGRLLELDRWWLLWAILFLFVLQPQQEKLMLYPMASVQAYFGLLFAMIYLLLILRSNRNLAAIAALFLSALTSGGWITLPVLGAVILTSRRDWKGLAYQAIAGIVLSIVYFSGAEILQKASISYATQHLLETLRWFFALLGSISEIPISRYSYLSGYTTTLTGIALFAYVAARVWLWTLGHGPAVGTAERASLIVFGYCLLMIGLLAANRIALYHDQWVTAALDGRYRIYSLVAFAVCLIDLMRVLEASGALNAAAFRVVLAGSLVFNLGWHIRQIDSAAEQASSRIQALQVWKETGDPTALPTWANSKEMAANALASAAKHGVFQPQ